MTWEQSEQAAAGSLFLRFQFNLGEIVAHKSNPRQRFTVLKRAVSESAAGYERTYTLFCVTAGGESPAANTLALFDVGECEIEEFDDSLKFRDD